jgi:mycothiol system anti-sigma-R factor
MRKETPMLPCSDTLLLVHAYLDNELDAGDSVRLTRHLEGCASCTDALERQAQLKRLLRGAAPHFPLPDSARARVLAALPGAGAVARNAPRSSWRALPTALAASLLLLAGGGIGMLAQRQLAASSALTTELLSDHLRSLQVEHLTDVATSNQHTVKPWFDGKLDFSPQVRDLEAEGFVLVGGRLDVLRGQRVAAIVYRRRLHAINLFQWPGSGPDAAPASIDAGDGFTAVHWRQDGMNCWAVSNLARGELAMFAAEFRQAPPLATPSAR